MIESNTVTQIIPRNHGVFAGGYLMAGSHCCISSHLLLSRICGDHLPTTEDTSRLKSILCALAYAALDIYISNV
jgi:hypothetical protein